MFPSRFDVNELSLLIFDNNTIAGAAEPHNRNSYPGVLTS